jgi:hypothetical protein
MSYYVTRGEHYFAVIFIQQIPAQRNIEFKKNESKKRQLGSVEREENKVYIKKISRYIPVLRKILLIPEFTREKGMKAEPFGGDSLNKQGQVFAD